MPFGRGEGFRTIVAAMYRCLIFILLAGQAAGAGCARSQAFVTPQRLERGLVMVLTGIEGQSRLNEDICRGLNDGGVNWAIELVDWTAVPGGLLLNLWSEPRNHQRAEELADRIVRYQASHPGRPVALLGQSGGGAMAVWIAEALPPGRRVEAIVLLAVSLSPGYQLDEAITRTRRGVVSFYSHKDWVCAGTAVTGTMDGEHTLSAGRVGFDVPARAASLGSYQKLFQVAWHEQMEQSGHVGGHLTSGARDFVARYVAPMVRSEKWDGSLIRAVLAGEAPASGEAGARTEAFPTRSVGSGRRMGIIAPAAGSRR